MKNYALLEHTADIAVRVRAGDLKELFGNTALAMFDIIAGKIKEKSAKKVKIKVRQKADTLDELFVNWLNELLFLSATKELVFSDFKINKLTEKSLEATLAGESVKNYKIHTEIKAATYHQLKIEKSAKGWLGEVIFDV